MNEVKKEPTMRESIEALLDQFAKEEYGNRLSQFAWMALKSLVLEKIDNESKKSKE